MTHTSIEYPPITASRGGGRISSDQFRHSQKLSNSFLGLEQDTSRYDLLLLVKRVGKHAGFTPRMIQLLDYYMAYTTTLDWEEGSRPVVFQSLARTALDLGVTERQIQKLEKQLFEAGAITWNDSGNHKRYGHRNAKTGRLSYAYGVELTPLAFLKPVLEAKLHEKQLYAKAWQDTKREISATRREFRSLLLEWQTSDANRELVESFERSYHAVALPIRTYMKLEDLRQLLKRHQSLLASLLQAFENRDCDQEVGEATSSLTEETASRDEKKFAHKEHTNPIKKINRSASPGRLRISQLVRCAGGRFREHLPIDGKRVSRTELVEAASHRRRELRISQDCWAEACQAIGREGAAVLVLLIDRKQELTGNEIRHPAAYFRSLIRKAVSGRLDLNNAVHELLTVIGES